MKKLVIGRPPVSVIDLFRDPAAGTGTDTDEGEQKRGRGRPRGTGRNLEGPNYRPKVKGPVREPDATRAGTTATTGIAMPYETLVLAKEHAFATGRTLSGYVTELLEEDMRAAGVME